MSEKLFAVEVPGEKGSTGRTLEVRREADGAEIDSSLLRAVPVVLEVRAGDETVNIQRGYDRLTREGDCIVGAASVRFPGLGALRLEDRWTRTQNGSLRVARRLRASEGTAMVAVRVELWLELMSLGRGDFASLRYFAPGLVYDKNDLDGDGVEDYLHATSLVAREDRIANRAFMAYEEASGYSLTLRRVDCPVLDEGVGTLGTDGVVMSVTDVGALGIEEDGPTSSTSLRFVGCYPFVDRPHSFAVRLDGTPGWRALRPITGGQEWRWEYELSGRVSVRFTDAMWAMVGEVAAALRPVPVAPRTTAEEVCRRRLEGATRYYVEGRRKSGEPYAGTVLNCHPQDGSQLANIVQLGFTNCSLLLAHDYLRAAKRWGDGAMAERARKAIDFVATEAQMGDGMLWNLYNVDTDRLQSWWGGLIAPLAYADEEGVKALMGPLYDHLRPVIEALSRTDGAYLRGMAEENDALLMCYEFEVQEGRKHAHWLDAALAFGGFLLRAQDDDGGWYRAYDLDEKPMLDPPVWFGARAVELKCSTAVAVPFLVRLWQVTGDDRFQESALRAGRFVAEELVEPVRWSGGIHDSIYGKGMLVDNESVLYCMEAMDALWKMTGDQKWRQVAYSAAQQCASWVVQWDVPLPTGSTLERRGFRSTGLGACDTCAAGSFIHHFLIRGVPSLLEIGLRERDSVLVDIAELCFSGCSQTVALWEGDWGYAVPGLQEEGYFASWWLINDPMFINTGFGDRLKGEGNKTALTWIPANGAYAFLELEERFGTADVAKIRSQAALTSLLGEGGVEGLTI